MAENLEKSKEQTKPFVVEPVPSSPAVVGNPHLRKDEDDDLPEDDLPELELDEDEDEEPEDEIVLDDEDDDEPTQKEIRDALRKEEKLIDQQSPVKLSKEQRKIQALKNQAMKLQAEKAELERKLSEKGETERKQSLVKKYVDKGFDESDATEKADSDIRQSKIEKQLEALMFEKQNRKVLEKYPQADADLDRIMVAAKASGMTVEQVCRGLYGVEVPERERRAIAALTDTGTPEPTGDVSDALKSAKAPTKSKLTDRQLALKRFLERKYKMTKPMTDEEVITIWNNS